MAAFVIWFRCCGAGLPGPLAAGVTPGARARAARARFSGIRRRSPEWLEATEARAVGGEAGASLLMTGAGCFGAGPAFAGVAA